MSESKGLSYKDAGVDIDAGNRAVQLLKGKVSETHGDEVLERALVVVVQAAAAHGHDQQRCDPRPPAPRPAAAPGVVEHDD